MANPRVLAAGGAVLALIIAGLAWAGGMFSPPVLEGPAPPTGGPFSGCIPTDTGPATRPVDHPRHAGDRYIYRDGTQVRDTDLDGRPATLQLDGSLRYPDGTVVSHNSDTGETTITHPDGRVTHSSIRMPTLVDGSFVWGDGASLPGTDPSGGAGKILPDGSVSFPDGTIVMHDPATGMSKTTHPDGRVTEVRDPGTRRDGDGNLEWNDGLRAPRDPGGTEPSATPAGWLRYPDGTMLSHDPASGESKIVRPDGTIVTHNSDTCETKVIPIAGGCLGAPPVIDQCLLGTWRQTGGGPLEWVRRNVRMGDVQMPQAEVTPLEVTFKRDGSFQTTNGAMDMEFYRPNDPSTTDDDPVTGKVRGEMSRVTGFWSASNGEMKACIESDDGAKGTVTASSPKHSITTPFSFEGSAGSAGGSSYSCSGTSFKTFTPMPRGEPMEYSFTLISK